MCALPGFACSINEEHADCLYLMLAHPRRALFKRQETGAPIMMARDNIAHDNVDPALAELEKERTLGGPGATKIREVPRIDLSDFEARKSEIADQLWQASTDIGFFQIVNHGIPQQQIDEAFAMTERSSRL